MIPRLLALLCGAFALLCGALAPSVAHAVPTFPIKEGFRNSTVGPEWHMSGSAGLTAPSDGEGNGWLRLTSTVNNQVGVIVNDNAFDSDRGVLAEFEYATHSGTGADGLVFFLYNGNVPYSSFARGPLGGSIGYTSCHSPEAAGLTGAYVGVAFDEWGNFANGDFCNQNGGMPDGLLRPGRVVIRGGVDSDYQYLTSQPVDQGLIAQRTQARHIKVAVTPDMKLSVYITFPDGEIQTVTSDYPLPSNVPATLKMGFVAATGGSNNVHEIRSTQVVYPADLHTEVTDSLAGSARDDEHTWTATVTNHGPNPVTDAPIKATAPMPGLTNVTWTCSASTGATCDAASGAGLPDTTADLPEGASVTYTLKADIDPAMDYAQLRFVADQDAASDTGELDPTDNAATDTTYLTPLHTGTTKPTFTLAANGTATVAGIGTTWLGGALTYAYQWQRCDVDGTNCADIPSATGTTYSTQTADGDHTLGLKVTATNAAGSGDAYSAVFASIPDTQITSGPAAVVGTTAADLVFGQLGGPLGTTLECSLDNAPYAACASPHALAGLAAGSHTLNVRAVYGGLTDPTPATHTWTVDLDAELAITGPRAGETATNRPTVTGTGEPGSTVTIKVDGAIVATGVVSPDGTFAIPLPAPLADGERTLTVTIVDGVGNTKSGDVTLKVDTTAPGVPGIPVGPAPTSGSPEATFTFEGDPGSTFKCRLDGDAWRVCTSPFAVNGLPDGPHTLSVVAVDKLGNESPRRDHTWTVDTDKPAAPPVMTGPEHKTKATSARFDIDVEPGATLECSLDGATFAACTSPIELHGLPEGKHELAVRQIDAAGNVSAPQRFNWEVGATGPATTAGKVTARVSTAATARGNRHVRVGCRLDGAGLRTCTVKAYATVDGRKVLVGSGKRSGHGKSSGLVSVKLNRTGRRLVRRALGGLKLRLQVTARAGGRTLKAHKRTVLFPQRLMIVPTINPFDFDVAHMNAASRKAIRALARDLRRAKSVRCVGHTDSIGSAAYNAALGLRRARVVCAALARRGVDGTRASSAGERAPRASNATRAGRRANRRVALRVAY